MEDSQKKAVSMSALTFLAVIVFGNFAIIPSIKVTLDLKTKIEDLKKQDTTLHTTIKNLVEQENNQEQLKEYLDLIKVYLPNEKKETDLINILSEKSSKSFVVITKLTIGSSIKETSGLSNTEFSISANGSVENLIKFVGFLERSKRAITIHQVEILKTKLATKNSADSSLNASGKFYFVEDSL